MKVKNADRFAANSGVALASSGTTGYELASSVAGAVTTYTVDPITYAISYELAGGELASGVTNPETYTIESAAITLNNPTRTDYNFLGWFGTGLDATNAAVTIAAGSIGDRAYTSIWQRAAVQIRFLNWNGDVLQSSLVDIGQTPAYTGETPTRESSTSTVYTFAGWTPEVVPAADAADYTAAFNEAARTYAITWSWKDANGNDASTTDDVAFGTTPSAPSIPASYVANDVIYTFSAWSPTVEAVSGTATYTAQYTQSAAKATVITITDAGATTNVIGTYASFVEAVEAVPNGGTIVLLADDNVGADRIQVSTKSYTVDLNGQTLSSTEDDNIIFRVSNGQTITINGTTDGSTLVGTVMIAGSNTAVQEGHIVVNGGTVYGAAIAVSPHNTNKLIAVEINGGTFTAEKAVYENYVQTQPRSETTAISLNGGSFVGEIDIVEDIGTVIPSDSTARFSDKDADGVAPGYALKKVAGTSPALYEVALNSLVTSSGSLGAAPSTTVYYVPGGTTPQTNLTMKVTYKRLVTGFKSGVLATNLPDDLGYAWSSSDTSVATVEDGIVTILQPGSATITLVITDALDPSITKTVSTKVSYDQYRARIVGGDYYATLGSAVNKAVKMTNATIEMCADENVNAFNTVNITGGGTITLDLAGHSFTSPSNVQNMFNVKNVTVGGTVSAVAQASIDWPGSSGMFTVTNGVAALCGDVAIKTANLATIRNGGSFVMAGGTATNTNSGVWIYDGGSFTMNGGSIAATSSGVVMYGAGAAFTMNGGAINAETGVSANGSQASNTTIAINGGAITAPASGSGVFHSQSGTLAISGGTITGGTAVFASRGTVNVTGGELVATGAAVADYTPPASYYSVSGDALVLVNRSAPVANITGGKFTSANAKAVASYASGSSEAVSGFLGAATAAGTAIFSDNESDGLANGYVFVDSETAGYYKVVGTATIIWVVDGQTPVTNKVAVGTLTASIQPEDPTKASVGQTAYSFTGWSPEVAETVTADATYVAQFIEGYDWTVDPFIITTEAELRAFAAAVNGGYGFTNQTVMLGNDITLTSAFTPIGQYEGSAFSGTFDGAGYTVSGLSIDGGTTARYQALFGRIEGATIKNVTVGGTVSAKDAAGIVARMDGGVVSNCVNNVAVTGGAKAGGIVGLYKTGTATVAGNGVIDCSNSGDITDTCSSGTDRIGGIVGIVEASGTPTAAVAIDGNANSGDLVSVQNGTIYWVAGFGDDGVGGTYDDNTAIVDTVAEIRSAKADAKVETIKLGANVADPYELAADETLVLAQDGKTITVTAPTGYSVVTTTEGELTTYTAQLNKHTVIWVVDGQTPVTNLVDYGTVTATVTPADPTKDADEQYTYTFTGWLPELDATVTSNSTYVAQFSQEALGYKAGDTVNGVELTAAEAAWLNGLYGEGKTYATKTAFDEAIQPGADIEKCYLLNCDPTVENAGGTITITSITVGSTIDVAVTISRVGADEGTPINGTLKLLGTASLTGAFAEVGEYTFTNGDFDDSNVATTSFTDAAAKFFRAKIVAPAAPAQDPQD